MLRLVYCCYSYLFIGTNKLQLQSPITNLSGDSPMKSVIDSSDFQLQIQFNQDTIDEYLQLIEQMKHTIKSISIIQDENLCPTIVQWVQNKIKCQNQKKRYHQFQLKRKAQYQQKLLIYKTQNIFRINNRYYTKGLIKLFQFQIHQLEADHQCLIEARSDGLHVFSIKEMSEMEKAIFYSFTKSLSSYISYDRKVFIKCKYSKIIQQKLENKSIHFDFIANYRTYGLHFYCSEYTFNREKLFDQIRSICKEDVQLIRLVPKDSDIQSLQVGYQILADYIEQQFQFEKQLYEVEMEYNSHYALFVFHCRDISFNVEFKVSIRQKIEKMLLIRIQNIGKATFNLKLKSYSDGQHQWVKQTHSKNTLFVVIDCELAEEKYLITYLKDLAKTIQSNAINLSNRFNICIQHFNCIKDKQINSFIARTIQKNSLSYQIKELPLRFIMQPSQNVSSCASTIVNTVKQIANYLSNKYLDKANEETVDTSVDGDVSCLLQEYNKTNNFEQLNERNNKYLKCPVVYSEPKQRDISQLYQKTKRNTRYQNIINKIYNIPIKIWDLILTSQIHLPLPNQINRNQIYFTSQLLQDKNMQSQNLLAKRLQEIVQGDLRNGKNTGFGFFLTEDRCRYVPVFAYQILGKCQ